jgi:hypothetical protein
MESDYFWVVICKNQLQHIGHPILLGETDQFSDLPSLQGDFKVQCDVCGKECNYSSRDLLRFEAEAPKFFVAHPLFIDLDSAAMTRQTNNMAPSSPVGTPTPSIIQTMRNLLHRSRGTQGIKKFAKLRCSKFLCGRRFTPPATRGDSH